MLIRKKLICRQINLIGFHNMVIDPVRCVNTVKSNDSLNFFSFYDIMVCTNMFNDSIRETPRTALLRSQIYVNSTSIKNDGNVKINDIYRSRLNNIIIVQLRFKIDT